MANREIFIPMTSDEIKQQMKEILSSWESFFSGVLQQTQGMDKFIGSHYTVNSKALQELVNRVHQRKDYFTRYHSELKMSEFKEIGLNMFWLSKLKPFSVVGSENIDAQTFDINEDFALYHMCCALQAMAQKLNISFDKERLPSSLYFEMSYCMSFRDMSKEAMGMLVELVARVVMPDIYLIEKEQKMASQKESV